MKQLQVKDIRKEFINLLKDGKFVTDKTGVKTVEIIGTSFIADEPAIFGSPNESYISRELEWYLSTSLNVNDIPGVVPKIWKQVATPEGLINSNYGYLIFSPENGNQYQNVLAELKRNPNSRRSVMVYQRPSIWSEYNKGGMSDFICTNAVGYLIRDGKLHANVSMRSNDAVFGYPNDLGWQKWVLEKLASELGVLPGFIYWLATSLHVYESHFSKIELYF